MEISGNNPTKPVQSFSDAGLLPTVEANVRKANYKKPTPVQKYSIPAIIAGRDLMGCAQTGSGKTVRVCEAGGLIRPLVTKHFTACSPVNVW